MSELFLLFVFIGFIAQIIDGCLGMAYGVISTTFLTAFGLSPVSASASVHFAEIFTTFFSAASHIKFKNVDIKLMKKLLIPGILGGIIGAYLLTEFDPKFIKPFIAIYLLILGLNIVIKGIKNIQSKNITDKIIPLGLCGGFFDAVGGGGWGPIVTSTLVSRGNNPSKTIGTVNTVEFFVTMAQSITFFFCIGSYFQYIEIVSGLLLGGIIAAPLAAFLCKKMNLKILTILVGCLIIVVNSYILLKFFNYI